MRAKKIFPMLTVLMIAVIWGHSMMPGEVSADESGFLTDFLQNLFNFTSVDTEHIVRKCAHFFEYMILGILFAIDMILYKKRPFCPAAVIPGLLVPQVDESIQLFTPERSGSLVDVWLDFSGYVTGMIFVGVIYKIVKKKA